MNQHDSESPIPGLAQLTRRVEPPADLWPGIQVRLRPRHRSAGFPAWGGLALAASLLAAIVLPLREAGVPAAASGAGTVPSPAQQVAYFAAQFKEVRGAETELLEALKLDPQSPLLKRLLESTRERQRELRRLAIAHV